MSFSTEYRSRYECLFSLFASCHRIVSRGTFADEIYPILKEIIPHKMFLCGIANVNPLDVLDSINIGFPEIFISDCIGSDERANSPLIRNWLTQNEPVFFSEQFSTSLCNLNDIRWLEKFRLHNMRNMAAHGLKDLRGGAASYFCFAGIPEWSEEVKQTFRMIIPHLHSALYFHYQLGEKNKNRTDDLSLREGEVLKLICIGKTNHEIGLILGISPWTVKIHVRNLMSKLNVSTRGHAAAKATQNNLVDIKLSMVKKIFSEQT